MTCTAAIRPFRGVNDAEVRCERDEDHGPLHRGPLRDYAFPGSLTNVEWLEDDRRTFHGDWPGACRRAEQLAGCVLPTGHRGRCQP